MPDTLHVKLALTRGAFALDVAFEAAPGVTVLFGPSGAGKSTVLDAVAGLVDDARGSVRLGDVAWLDSARGVRVPTRVRRVGYVFQSLALFPHRSVIDNVTYGLPHVPDRDARARALLSRAGVEDLSARKPGSLSGGEKQRVALVRALAPDPRVLLCDEPFAALDRARRRDLGALLRCLVDERRIPAVFVTHDQDEAESLGDRVVRLENGRVVAEGAPLEVLDAPTRGTPVGAVNMDNRWHGRVIARDAADGSLEVRVGEVTLRARLCEADVGEDVDVAIRAVDVTVARDAPGRISASNVLRGTVLRIAQEGRAVRVVADCGIEVCAEVTPSARMRLELAVGTEVWMLAKARACWAWKTAP